MPLSNRYVALAGAAGLLLYAGSAALAQSTLDARPRAYGTSDAVAYDEVGQARTRDTKLSAAAAVGVTAAHGMLPPETYVEVTALATGMTILVRIDEQAADGNSLIQLSPDAAAQLGLSDSAPVRVRRVNPSAQEQAVLRAGGRAAARLNAPPALLTALRKRMPQTSSRNEPPSLAVRKPGPGPSMPAQAVSAKPAIVPVTRSDPISPAVKSGRYFVQIAAFSSAQRAEAVASRLDAQIVPGGGFWRVRLGPYANQSEAQAAVQRAAGKGFENGRIMVIDAP